MWLPPGGHIEKDETPDDALKREFKEELDFDIEILGSNEVPRENNIVKQLAVPFYVNVHNVGDHDHCCFYYLCKPKSTKIFPNKAEVNKAAWFSKQELIKVSADVRNIAEKAFEMLENLKYSEAN
ncbi:MAG: NUDIX hydrolase [Candidatus Aenigmarchaeota archaeon]|nr:NUDIX hydrolase [Candidatus Aenigmarchaeota archaeon]